MIVCPECEGTKLFSPTLDHPGWPCYLCGGTGGVPWPIRDGETLLKDFKMKRDELILLLQNTDIGTCSLSRAFFEALGWTYEYRESPMFQDYDVVWTDPDGIVGATYPIRHSPAECFKDAEKTIPNYWRGDLILHKPGRENGILKANYGATLHSVYSSGGGPRVTGFGATPALALCVGILEGLNWQEKNS